MSTPFIADADRVTTYDPVASTGPFPVTFPVFEETGADLHVTLDGEPVTNWTAVATTYPGFYGAPNTYQLTLTFDVAITGALVIEGRRAPRRISQFSEGRGIPSRDHNTALNELTAIAREFFQRLRDLDSRLLESAAVILARNEAESFRDLAREWAENPENTGITGLPGGRSALHHAAKAAAFASDAATVSGVNVPLFATRMSAAGATIAAGVLHIRTAGESAVGDGQGGLYIDVDNGSDDTFMSSGGTARTWYRVADVSTRLRVHRDRFDDAPELVQAKLMEPFFGFNDGTTDTQIYAGARNALQGLSILNVAGIDKVFTTQRVEGANWSAAERQRIIELDLLEDGSTVPVTLFTAPLNIGHGFDLTARIEGGNIYLYTSQVIDPSLPGILAGKGFSRIEWKGAATTQSDVESFVLWGQPGSGHPYQDYNRAGVCISDDGKYLIMSAVPSSIGGAGRPVLVYDFAEVMALSDKLEARPAYWFFLPLTIGQGANILQGLCSDGKTITFATGGTDSFGQNQLVETSIDGSIRRFVQMDGATAQYGIDGMLDNPSLGHPWRFELEGVCNWRGGRVVTVVEGWLETAPIVSFESENWACITADDTTGVPPSNGAYWVRTTKAATAGAWNVGTNYANTSNFSLEKKTLYYAGAPIGLSLQEPIAQGIADQVDPSALNAGQGGGANSIGFQWRSALTMRAWAERFRKFFNAVEYDGGSRWRVHDQRVGSNNVHYTSMQATFSGAERSLRLAAKNGDPQQGSSVRYFAGDDPQFPHAIREQAGPLGSVRRSTDQFGQSAFNSSSGFVPLTGDRPDSGRTVTVRRDGVDIGGLSQNTAALKVVASSGLGIRFATMSGATENDRWEIDSTNGNLRPMADNAVSLGQGSRRPTEIFAVTGTINTSDARDKQQIRELTEAEIRVGRRIKQLIRAYKWNDAVKKKGDSARLHVGVMAQDVANAFAAEGLDALHYGVLCFDEWSDEPEERDETGSVTREYVKAGNRFGVRHDQLWAFVVSTLTIK